MRCLALSGILLFASPTEAQKKAFKAQKAAFGIPTILKGARAFPGRVAVADFDLDGRRDLAVANAFALDITNGPASTYYLNRDLTLRQSRNLPATGEPGLFSYPAITAADLNADGLEDILILSDRGSLSLYLNQGPKDPKDRAPRFKSSFKARRISMMAKSRNAYFYLRNSGFFVEDFDQDGNLDLVMAGEMTFLNDVQGYTGILFLKGDGKGAFGKEQSLLTAPVISLAKGDVDGDGRIDLVALDSNDKVHVLRSIGRGKFKTTTWLSSSPTTPLILRLGDANGDGRDDILIGGGKTKAEATLYMTSQAVIWSRKTRVDLSSAKATRTEAMVFEDLNGDKRADLALLLSRRWNDASVRVMASTGKNFILLEEHGLKSMIDPLARVPAHTLLQAMDFDGDLNPELVVGSLVIRGDKRLVQLVLRNLASKKVGERIYGKGYVTGAGVIPAIATYGGRPALGNGNWGIALSRTNQGNQRAVLFLFHNTGGPWTGPGFSINVFPRWSIGAKTKGTGALGGYAQIPLRIPRDSFLLGKTFHFQWLVEDAAARRSNGIAVSRALAVTFVAR